MKFTKSIHSSISKIYSQSWHTFSTPSTPEKENVKWMIPLVKAKERSNKSLMNPNKTWYKLRFYLTIIKNSVKLFVGTNFRNVLYFANFKSTANSQWPISVNDHEPAKFLKTIQKLWIFPDVSSPEFVFTTICIWSKITWVFVNESIQIINPNNI